VCRSADGDRERVFGRGVQLIEPLWGMLRDPFDRYCNELRLTLPGWKDSGGQSKAHILPQGYAPYAYHEGPEEIPLSSWRTHGVPPWHSWPETLTAGESTATNLPKREHLIYRRPPRRILLDVGSSYFGNWRDNNYAASGSWFYNMYHTRGQPFDRFVAVEVSPLSVQEVYKQLPPDLAAAYTLINAPLNVGEGDTLDVVKLIEGLVKPNDFFVLKVDVDSASIEQPFAEYLCKNATLASLVDEMMFEDHVDIVPMRPYWGSSLPRNLADSYVMFAKLRHRGIRAHSWP
jgi:hypothetical protein